MKLLKNILRVCWLVGADLKGHFIERIVKKGPGNVERVLLIMLAGIGNMVLFLPVIKTLKKNFPESKVTLLVGPRGTEDLFQGTSLVDEVIVYDRKREKEPGYRDGILRLLREKSFDLGISQFASFWSAKFLTDAGVRYKVGFRYPLLEKRRKLWVPYLLHDAPRYDENEHEIVHNMKLMRRIPGKKVVDISIDIAEEESEWADRELVSISGNGKNYKFVGFHNGAYLDMPQKKWRNQFFGEVGKILREKYGAVPVIFGGELERADAEEIARVCGGIPVAGKYKIRETASLIQKCSLFISTDSGLMHIAASVGTPVVGIFGPTSPNKSAPFAEEGKKLIVLKRIPCQPCYRPYTGKIPCEYPACMMEFSPSEFMEQAGGFIGDFLRLR